MGDRDIFHLRAGAFEVAQGLAHHRLDAPLDPIPEVLAGDSDP